MDASTTLDALKTHRWTGTLLAIVAAIMVASNTDISKYGYPIFMVSSMFWSYVAIKMKDQALLLLQVVFICIDGFGIYNWFIV